MDIPLVLYLLYLVKYKIYILKPHQFFRIFLFGWFCEKIDGYEWNDDEKCHDHCVPIWKDIKDNNESYEHDKIIISKDFCYWIGSQQETKDFLKSLWKSLSPRLKRYWHYVKKVGMDGIGKLFDKNGNQNQLNDFYEVFNSYDISMLEEIGEK